MAPPDFCPKCSSANLKIARCKLYPGQWVMICAFCYHALTYGAAAKAMFERKAQRVGVPAHIPAKDRVWN